MQSASQSLSSLSGRMSFTNNLSACNNFVHNASARPTARSIANKIPEQRDVENLVLIENRQVFLINCAE
jgi:hypothetical protein